MLEQPDKGPVRFPSGRSVPARFIDVGCGDGRKTSAMASAWRLDPDKAIGMDIVKPDAAPENITFLKMSPEGMPAGIDPDSQDLALVSMVLHHANDTEVTALLRSIHSALPPGGYLVVRDHNADPDLGLADFLDTVHIFYDSVFLGVRCMPNAQNYKSLAAWHAIFETEGFAVVRTDYVPFSTDAAKGDARNTGENFTCVLKKKQPDAGNVSVVALSTGRS